MPTPHERFFHHTPWERWEGCSTRKFDDHIPGLRAGNAQDILGLLANFNPRKCTQSVIKAVLAHLALGKVPETVATRQEAEAHANVKTAMACLSLLDLILGLSPGEATLAKDAQPLVLASLDGIVGWIHFCMDFQLVYRVATFDEAFSLGHYAQLPFKISISDPKNDCGPFSALNCSKRYIHLLIRLWTTPENRHHDVRKSFYIAWARPDVCPVLYLLEAMFQTCCGNGPGLIEEVLLHGFGRSFTYATCRRAEQVAQVVAANGYNENIKVYAAKLLKLVQNIYQCQDPRLRECFDGTNYLAALARMVNSLSRHVSDQESLREKLAEPIINLYIHAMYCRSPDPNPHRALCRNFRGLLRGGYLEMHARCLSMGRGNVLDSFSCWTLSPHVLDVLIAWEEEEHDTILEPLFDYPDSRDFWRTFWEATKVRVRLYKCFRNDEWSNTCDNISCVNPPLDRSSKTSQCGRCSSMTYCSSSCQRTDWLGRHRSECLSARKEHSEQKEAGTMYSHRSRAFHIAYLELLFERHAAEISQAVSQQEGDLAATQLVPIFDCTGLGESLKFANTRELLASLSQAPEGVKRGFREGRYEQLAREVGTLAEGIFKHDCRSDIHLLGRLTNDDGGYKVTYSAFLVHHTKDSEEGEE